VRKHGLLSNWALSGVFLELNSQNSFGTRSFTVPFLGVTIPEIPLFRDVRHMGHAALESYTLEEDGGKFLYKTRRQWVIPNTTITQF
jgi:hypothetical protein